MCLILLAWRSHPRYPLVFAGNRDESYDRPSAPAEFWRDDPRIYGGRDLEKGGTWLGLSLSGRIAAVTNYRERPRLGKMPRSRGELTARFLRGSDAPADYFEQAARSAGEYGPFSLIAGDGVSLWYYSNRAEPNGSQPPFRELAAGVYGLSNHLLDTPWLKVTSGKGRLGRLLGAAEAPLVSGLFDILGDRDPAPDAELPDTGVGARRERELSPLFIAGEHYGTRASTVVLIDRDQNVLFVERRFGPRGEPLGITEQRFALETRDSRPETGDQKTSAAS
jgi:uncharacterized protein with NRDE domain